MDDVQSALKELFAETLQSMLEAELDTELGYEKHDVKEQDDGQQPQWQNEEDDHQRVR